MRKIAANYILLPGFEFVKNGYVVLKDGMVVDARVRQHIVWSPGDPIREKILQLYRENKACGNGLALIQGADFSHFIWTPESRIIHLR